MSHAQHTATMLAAWMSYAKAIAKNTTGAPCAIERTDYGDVQINAFGARAHVNVEWHRQFNGDVAPVYVVGSRGNTAIALRLEDCPLRALHAALAVCLWQALHDGASEVPSVALAQAVSAVNAKAVA